MRVFQRVFGLVWVLLSFSLAARAQMAVAGSEFDVRLSSGGRPAVSLGTTKKQVIRALGPPTKTSRFYDEIDRAWATTLHYGPNELVFTKDELGIVLLRDGRFTVGGPGAEGFRVGSVLPRPAAGKKPLAFGHFLVNHTPGKARNLAYSAISYGNMKTPQGRVADAEYGILYDQNGRIFHIYLDQTYD